MKRSAIIVLLLLFSFFHAFADDGVTGNDNLVINGGFEDSLERWSSEAYINTKEAVDFLVSEGEAYAGRFSMTIINSEPNDSKVIQWIDVKPDSYYRVSCQIRAEGTDMAKRGASITVLGLSYTSRDVHDTKGKWEYVEIYGKTGPAQQNLAVSLRLGFYGSLTTGRADFDDVRVVPVSELPRDVTVINFFTDEKSGDGVELINAAEFNPVGLILIGSMLLAAVIGLALMAGIAVGRSKKRKLTANEKPRIDDVVEATGSQTERRMAPRKKLNVLLTIKKIAPDGGYKIINFKIRDISGSGTFILSEDITIFHVGEEVMISIMDNVREYILGNAVIVRSEKGYDKNGVLFESGYGIMFTSAEAASCPLLK
ncbi:MAG: PilZ domain-containing protein [Spirochaetales bacterium]|nr:PilZ domain-containing protein [Spirochaetales bacterium]